MRISDRYEFIYFAIPRSGSTSIRTMLDEYSNIHSVHVTKGELFHHIFPNELIRKYDKEKVERYKKFVVMRRPDDRLLSLYFHHIKMLPNSIVSRTKRLSLFSYVLFIVLYCIRKKRLMASAFNFIDSAPGVDAVFFLESPILSLQIASYLGIPEKKVPHLNAIHRAGGRLECLNRKVASLIFRKDCLLWRAASKNGFNPVMIKESGE